MNVAFSLTNVYCTFRPPQNLSYYTPTGTRRAVLIWTNKAYGPQNKWQRDSTYLFRRRPSRVLDRQWPFRGQDFSGISHQVFRLRVFRQCTSLTKYPDS